MKRADRVFAFVCLGLSAWLILESRNYDYMTTFTPGPGFHPFWLGIILGLLSLCLIYGTFRRTHAEDDQAARTLEKKGLLRAGAILLITAGLAFAMDKVGFVLATFLFVVLILKVMEEFSFTKSVMIGALLSASIFLVFRFWLNVDLPRGWLGL